MNEPLYFSSDYMEGAHPAVMRALERTNMTHTVGYGVDGVTEGARDLIRGLCGCPDAAVYFLAGGTITNLFVIDSVLRPWQGVLCSQGGHIATHEAGAIEQTGHKVLTLPHEYGKITAAAVKRYIDDFIADGNREHMVEPGMVYISQPTEYGTVYTKAELEALAAVCRTYSIPLYADGARLACALAASDVTLADMARLTDAFYIGGTKCGALFGEALVIRDAKLLPYPTTQLKRHGALIAKGRIPAVMFTALLEDGLYTDIGRGSVQAAARIADALTDAGIPLYIPAQTNQIFAVVPNDLLPRLDGRVVYSFFEKYDDTHAVIRFCTSWATAEEDVDALVRVIASLKETT